MRTVLLFVVLIGLGAVVGAFFVGSRVFDGTVVESPYERGLAWDVERQARKDSGLTVTLSGGPYRRGVNLIDLRVLGPEGEPIGDDRLELRIGRPASASYDRSVTALRQEDGSFRARVELPLRGKWTVVVVVRREGRDLEFSRGIFAAVETDGDPAPRTGGGECAIDEGPCRADDGAGTEVSFEITPRPVRTMSELQFTVGLKDAGGPVIDAEVLVELTMPGMYMGKNMISLDPSAPGSYRGSGTIVRCPSGEKTWRATVRSPSIYSVDFTFRVDR